MQIYSVIETGSETSHELTLSGKERTMITVNGKNVELPHPMSVAEYLETNQYSAGRIAVELITRFCPKRILQIPCSPNATHWKL